MEDITSIQFGQMEAESFGVGQVAKKRIISSV